MSSPADRVQWQPDTPKAPGSYYPMLSPAPGQSIRAVILCERYIAVATHFHEKRTIPCIGEENGCPHHGPDCSTRWKAYLGVYHIDQHRPAILELTAEAVRHCPELPKRQGSLRGMLARVFRKGGWKTAPARCELTSFTSQSPLPPAFDLKTALLRLWGMLETVRPHARGSEEETDGKIPY